MNPNVLTDSSMTLPLGAFSSPGTAAPTSPSWLSGETMLALAIGLVALCATLVLCLHG